MRRREWISVVCIGAAIAASIFLIGGAFRWAQAIVAALVAIAVIAQVPSRRVLGRVSPLIGALGLAALLTTISLVPVPSAVRDALDPIGNGLRDDGAAILDLSPWPALTRDAPGSLRSLIFFLTLLGVAVVALRMSASERGRYRILVAVGLACCATAVTVGVHSLVGATRLYGVYEVEHARPSVLGPLLNENHLGSLMALGTCVALGLAMHRRQHSWIRVAWIAGVVACGATAAASGSRGALIALGVSGLATAGILIGQRLAPPDTGRRPRAQFTTSSLPIAIVAICVVVVAVYTSGGKVTGELGRTSTAEIHQPHSKFFAWRSSKSLIKETPWVGVGRGGFESSFTRVHPAEGSVTFSHVENEYIQTVVDWGVPGALLMLALGLWFGTVALRHWRDGSLAAGAIGGMVAIAVQSNVDFGIELLGVAVPLTAIAATLSYVPLREETSRTLLRSRAIRTLHAAALLAGTYALFSSRTTTLEEDHVALMNRQTTTLADIRASLTRHPHDYYGFARAAELMSAAGDPTSIRLLNHALRLHPTLPDLHRMAARLLLRGNHADQAAGEYALALRSVQDPTNLLKEITDTFPPEQAADAIPIDYPNASGLVQILDRDHAQVASIWLTRAVQAHPKDARLCNLLYDMSLRHGDLRAAEAAGRSCLEILPDHQTRLSLANVLSKKGGNAEVIRLLQDISSWQGRLDDKVKGWLTLCDAYAALDQLEEAARCLHYLDATGDVPLAERGAITTRLDAIKEKRRTRDVGSGSAGSASP